MSQFKQITITVSKKENGKFAEVGKQDIYVPVLADILQYVTSPIKKDEKGNEVYEDGLPVYEQDNANWVQGAILAAVKAQARNKMVPGTATLKDGQKIATNWEELTAEGVRDGSGLALAREFKAAFAEWVAKQGLSEAAANTLITLVSNKAALTLQQQGTKDKVKARLEKFAEDLDETKLEKFTRPLESAINACEAAADTMDF
jgi:hypothetical protein